jgi:hypothetical protein
MGRLRCDVYVHRLNKQRTVSLDEYHFCIKAMYSFNGATLSCSVAAANALKKNAVIMLATCRYRMRYASSHPLPHSYTATILPTVPFG